MKFPAKVIFLTLALSGLAGAAAEFSALPPSVQTLLQGAAPVWPQLDVGARARLVANAEHWLALDSAGRQALRLRMQAWDRRPVAERQRVRAPFDAWQQLPPGEQARVRTAAATLRTLPGERQAALRAAYGQLPEDVQQSWWLGPALAGDALALAPLFAFVPEAERTQLLQVLRELSPAARGDLVRLAPRLGEAQKQKFRRELLAAPVDAREALIQRWLAQ